MASTFTLRRRNAIFDMLRRKITIYDLKEKMRMMHSVDQTTGEADLVHNVTNVLASIRSAAEILCDGGNLKDTDRVRFAEVVLAGERRLEKLLRGMTKPQSRNRQTGS